MLDQTPASCSKRAVIEVVQPGPHYSTISISAVEQSSQTSLLIPVRIRPLSRLSIVTKSLMMNIRELQKLEITGYDAEQNTFTSLEGLRFRWTLEQEGKIITKVSLTQGHQRTAWRTGILERSFDRTGNRSRKSHSACLLLLGRVWTSHWLHHSLRPWKIRAQARTSSKITTPILLPNGAWNSFRRAHHPSPLLLQDRFLPTIQDQLNPLPLGPCPTSRMFQTHALSLPSLRQWRWSWPTPSKWKYLQTLISSSAFPPPTKSSFSGRKGNWSLANPSS